jgi:rhamnogalacturonyl hydrolase YesR
MLIFKNLVANDEDHVLKEKILNAVTIGADYASQVLLDETGKSRCDYNITEGRWYDYEPPWHTGQIIYALVQSYQVTQNNAYLEAAKKAADWWTGLEIKDHPKLQGMVRAVHGDHAGEVIVFATVSDGTAGLFRLYQLTSEKKYAEVPTQAGEWMLRNMWVPENGVFYDNVDPKTGEVLKENSPFWPQKEKQTLFDVARPNNEGSLFKDMYQYTKNEKYKDIFIKICESLVEKQGPQGLWMDFMPNHKDEGSFHPRFNLWYAESLLEGYELTADRRYLDAALKKFKKQMVRSITKIIWTDVPTAILFVDRQLPSLELSG